MWVCGYVEYGDAVPKPTYLHYYRSLSRRRVTIIITSVYFVRAACQKIIQQRLSASTGCLSDSRCSTPAASASTTPVGPSSSSYNHHHNHHQPVSSPAGSRTFSSSPLPSVHGGGASSPAHHAGAATNVPSSSSSSSFKDTVFRSNLSSTLNRQPLELSIALDNNNVSKASSNSAAASFDGGLSVPVKDLPTPSSTPTTTRKTRRRSNLFNPSKKDDKNRCLTTGEQLGSGRAIPLKQGYLYKRSSKGLNKEWKKKYVTLCDDGRLTYHPSLHVSPQRYTGLRSVESFFGGGGIYYN